MWMNFLSSPTFPLELKSERDFQQLLTFQMQEKSAEQKKSLPQLYWRNQCLRKFF